MSSKEFKTKLLGQAGSQVAALKPPFDLVSYFGSKGRVPAKGAWYRSSLMNVLEFPIPFAYDGYRKAQAAR